MSNLIRNYLDIVFPLENATNKKLRENEWEKFLKKGGVGYKLKNEYEKILRVTNLSKFLAEAYQRIEQDIKFKDPEFRELLVSLSDNFKENKICILPSFYKFLLYLKKNKKEYGVLFRTFGRDLQIVINEFNL